MELQVLIIDDNQDTLRAYTNMLGVAFRSDTSRKSPESVRFSFFHLIIETADTFSVARKLLQNKGYDLLIVDLKIKNPSGGEMGGLDIIDEATAQDPLRPIIAITGYGSVPLVRRTLTQGVFDFIEKGPNTHRELVSAVRKAFDSRKERILRSGNPFTPMAGVEPTFFGGRLDELTLFRNKIERSVEFRASEHLLVLGDWGIGKSSLLLEYRRMCHSYGLLSALVPLEPLQAGATILDAALSFVEGVFRDLPSPINTYRKSYEYLTSFGINVLGTGFHLGREVNKNPSSAQSFLHDTFQNLWQDVRNVSPALVVLLDDLDNFTNVPEFLMALRQTLSMPSLSRVNILFVMSTTSDSWKILTSNKPHHPISRLFMSRVNLPRLNENATKKMIRETLLSTGVRFSTDTILKVWSMTKGHPFEIQVLCHHVFNAYVSNDFNLQSWQKAVALASEQMGKSVFDNWLADISEGELNVLQVLAQQKRACSDIEIRQNLQAKKQCIALSIVQRRLNNLTARGITFRLSRGVFEIADGMFNAYVYNSYFD